MIGKALRYGLVGAAAACVYFSLVLTLVEVAGMKPLVANPLAFLLALVANYSGQRLWTFPACGLPHCSSAPRFLTVALLGFSINQGLLVTLLDQTALAYHVAVPAAAAGSTTLTFALSLLWAFSMQPALSPRTTSSDVKGRAATQCRLPPAARM